MTQRSYWTAIQLLEPNIHFDWLKNKKKRVIKIESNYLLVNGFFSRINQCTIVQ